MKKLLKVIIERLPTLALFLRNSRDLLDRNRQTKMTPWGFTLAGNDKMADGSFEPKETEIVRKLLKDVDIMINVGANVGYYCCHSLSLGKPTIAIEPIANNLHYLLRNIHDNGWAQQAEIFPLALGNRSDIMNMWGGYWRFTYPRMGI